MMCVLRECIISEEAVEGCCDAKAPDGSRSMGTDMCLVKWDEDMKTAGTMDII